MRIGAKTQLPPNATREELETELRELAQLRGACLGRLETPVEDDAYVVRAALTEKAARIEGEMLVAFARWLDGRLPERKKP